MKQELNTEGTIKIPGAKIAIIQSKWYSEYTDRMVEKCLEILKAAEAAEPEHHILPGSLELPLAARRVARVTEGIEAIIAFGVIVKGETFHFEMITHECMRGLGQVMMEEDIPILTEVIPVENIELIKARSADDHFNKGMEAANAAIEIIDWRRRVA